MSVAAGPAASRPARGRTSPSRSRPNSNSAASTGSASRPAQVSAPRQPTTVASRIIVIGASTKPTLPAKVWMLNARASQWGSTAADMIT